MMLGCRRLITQVFLLFENRLCFCFHWELFSQHDCPNCESLLSQSRKRLSHELLKFQKTFFYNKKCHKKCHNIFTVLRLGKHFDLLQFI